MFEGRGGNGGEGAGRAAATSMRGPCTTLWVAKVICASPGVP